MSVNHLFVGCLQEGLYVPTTHLWGTFGFDLNNFNPYICPGGASSPENWSAVCRDAIKLVPEKGHKVVILSGHSGCAWDGDEKNLEPFATYLECDFPELTVVKAWFEPDTDANVGWRWKTTSSLEKLVKALVFGGCNLGCC